MPRSEISGTRVAGEGEIEPYTARGTVAPKRDDEEFNLATRHRYGRALDEIPPVVAPEIPGWLKWTAISLLGALGLAAAMALWAAFIWAVIGALRVVGVDL